MTTRMSLRTTPPVEDTTLTSSESSKQLPNLLDALEADQFVCSTLDSSASKMRREADQRLREAEDLEKYGGVRASRKELYGGGSASEDEDASGDDDVSDDGEVPAGEDEDEEDEDMPFGQAENDDSSSSDEDAPFTPAAKSSAPTSNQTLEASQVLSSLRQSRSEDISKGLAVKRQLEFFENVLLVRMKLQKAVAGLGVLNVSLRELVESSRGLSLTMLSTPCSPRRPRRNSQFLQKRRRRRSRHVRASCRSSRRACSSCAQ